MLQTRVPRRIDVIIALLSAEGGRVWRCPDQRRSSAAAKNASRPCANGSVRSMPLVVDERLEQRRGRVAQVGDREAGRIGRNARRRPRSPPARSSRSRRQTPAGSTTLGGAAEQLDLPFAERGEIVFGTAPADVRDRGERAEAGAWCVHEHSIEDRREGQRALVARARRCARCAPRSRNGSRSSAIRVGGAHRRRPDAWSLHAPPPSRGLAAGRRAEIENPLARAARPRPAARAATLRPGRRTIRRGVGAAGLPRVTDQVHRARSALGVVSIPSRASAPASWSRVTRSVFARSSAAAVVVEPHPSLGVEAVAIQPACRPASRDASA